MVLGCFTSPKEALNSSIVGNGGVGSFENSCFTGTVWGGVSFGFFGGFSKRALV